MSYAEQVANMLGVKLREAFNIPGIPNMLFMITDEGVKFFNYEDKKWHTSSILSDIFCGSYKNIEKNGNQLDMKIITFQLLSLKFCGHILSG